MKNNYTTVKKIRSIVSVSIFWAFSLMLSLAAASPLPAQKNKKKSARQVQSEPIVLNSGKARGRKDRVLESERRRGRYKPKPRADFGCRTELKNNTNYRVDLYINGRLTGSAPAKGIFNGTVNFGANRLYARTDLVTNNNYYYWGPNSFTCSGNQGDVPIKLAINSKK